MNKRTSISKHRSKETHRNITAKSSTQRRRSNKKQQRSTSFMKKVIFALICLVVILASYIVVESAFNTPSVVKAEEHLSDIQYKLVEIKYGDTLWSIAEENMSPGYETIDEYIDEIKECNQLCSDQINDGNYLMIPYYEVLKSDTIVVSNN